MDGKMQDVFNKKSFVYVLGISVLMLAITAYKRNECFQLSAHCTADFIELTSTAFFVLLPFVLLLAPVIFTFFGLPAVFEAWKRFAIWAAPLVLALSALLLFAGESGPYGFSLGITPLILLVLYGIYFLASVIIIYIAARKPSEK